MGADRDKLLVEVPAGLPADPMRRCRRVVDAQLARQFAQPVQGFLQPVAQAQQRLRLAPRRPFPVGVRQHDVTEQVRVGCPVDAYPQFGGVRPVQLQRSSRFPVLREEHFLVRAVEQAPLLDASLERAQMFVGQTARTLLLQMFEQGLGLQLGRLVQQALGRRPDGRQRVFASPPGMLGLKRRRGCSRVEVLARGGPTHIGQLRTSGYVSSRLVFAHQSSVLLFRDHPRRTWAKAPRPWPRGGGIIPKPPDEGTTSLENSNCRYADCPAHR